MENLDPSVCEQAGLSTIAACANGIDSCQPEPDGMALLQECFCLGWWETRTYLGRKGEGGQHLKEIIS